MSPTSKSRSKDKKAGKDSVKASVKAGSTNGIGAYNPLHGSFHPLDRETSSSASTFQSNGRFQSIDDIDGTGGEFDASSINGSWSGESEDHKEKSNSQSTRQEIIPGAENDKRDKIRQKNERKHQRQKERRAQELHEKCGGYLMSRKLEALSQQLVSMGFSAERATMALILNEGKVNQSVTWLLEEGAEEADKRDQNLDTGGNLKIDISEELARIADLEIRYKCSKQEVERAVVACEGDIDKAAETLKSQKQEPPAGPPKTEETGDPPTNFGVKQSLTSNQCAPKAPPRPSSSSSTSQLRDEKDFNYTRTVVSSGTVPDVLKQNVVPQPLKKAAQPRVDWAKPQQIVAPVGEKKWPGLGTSSQVTNPVVSPLQVLPQLSKAEVRYVAASGGEYRNPQLIGSVREPVTVMQRQQPQSAKQFVVTSIATPTHTTVPSWHPTGGADIKSNGVVARIPSSRSFNSSIVSPEQLHNHQQMMYRHQPQELQQQQGFPANDNPLDPIRHAKVNGVVSKPATSATLNPASSLGLFSGTITPNISSGSSSPVDWSNGFDMRQIDYANIDWSLDRSGSMFSPSKQGGLWSMGMGLQSPFLRNGNHIFDPATGAGVPKPALKPYSSSFNGSNNGPGVGSMGIPTTVAGGGGGRGDAAMPPLASSSGAMGDWSSPFEERDIFSLPRQYVSSHSLCDDHRGI